MEGGGVVGHSSEISERRPALQTTINSWWRGSVVGILSELSEGRPARRGFKSLETGSGGVGGGPQTSISRRTVNASPSCSFRKEGDSIVGIPKKHSKGRQALGSGVAHRHLCGRAGMPSTIDQDDQHFKIMPVYSVMTLVAALLDFL